MKRTVSTVAVLAALLVAVCATAWAAGGGAVSTEPMSEAQAQAEALATMAYWTPERMAEAQPMPIPAMEVDLDDPALTVADDPEPLRYTLGWMPGDGPQPDPMVSYELSGETAAAMLTPSPQHGTMPTDPLNGPYGLFQRWTWFGAYVKRPISTLGRLYFSMNGGNWVCSATVAGRNVLITAGHCVADGSGNWGSNWMFCPSFNAGGINPSRGCWAWSSATTSGQWFNSGDPDYDYACIVTPPTGTVVADDVGDVTGWLGRAWNGAYGQPIMDFGYPAGAPFPGYHIIVAAAAGWYQFHFTAGDQISYFIGNDMTGGSSGGPWILGLGHRSAEWPDTDGSNATDPFPNGVGWIWGVNSHKRCVNGCFTPPTATAGTFWQEMSTPQFKADADGGESEDVFANCYQ
jgi:hypothetical protein